MEEDIDYIENNINFIKNNIKLATEKSGRNFSDITLLAVTKTVDIDKIKMAIKCGLKDLGENRVQELLSKYSELDKQCNWHLIGHLQTNKVKDIIDKVQLIHSVDSVKLAEEINKQAQKYGIIVDILIEVNISNEVSKFGISQSEIYKLINVIKQYRNIQVKGLMTVAPFVENPEENRKYFKDMYKLFNNIDKEKIDGVDMKYLSMGMTNDYLVAIEEGANIVRIGTGIFGKRDYIKKICT